MLIVSLQLDLITNNCGIREGGDKGRDGGMEGGREEGEGGREGRREGRSDGERRERVGGMEERREGGRQRDIYDQVSFLVAKSWHLISLVISGSNTCAENSTTEMFVDVIISSV